MISRKAQNSKKEQKFTNHTILIFLFALSLAGFIALDLFPHVVNAQMRFEVTGKISTWDANFHLIKNVQANDLVLISVNPVEGGSYFSTVRDPQLTVVSYISGSYGYPVWGSHSYQFIANKTGDYLLKIKTEDDAFNYTVKSSHQVTTDNPSQATPYKITGQIKKSDTVWYTIQSVNANDLVLININPVGGGSYFSNIRDPQLTVVSYISGSYGYPVGGSHSYQFIANKTGDYLLKFWTTGDTFNYTVKSSHIIPEDNLPSVPDFSLTPSTTPSSVETGSTSRTGIVVRSLQGFASDVSLSVSNLPTGISVTFEPNSVSVPLNGQTSSTMVISVSSSAKVGTAVLKVTGNSATLSHTCDINLVIKPVLAASSISCSLNTPKITYTEKVLITGHLDPPLSTGVTRLRSSHDNVTWSDISSGIPTQGRFDFSWMPEVGTHYVRAEWSGDDGHRSCYSVTRVLVVEKKATTIALELSREEIRPGEGVNISAEVRPAIDSQSISIQYAPADGNWQGLASGVTDEFGRFSHTWVPSTSGIFLLRSTWSGSGNYDASSSETRALIVTSATTTTRIAVSNLILNYEYGEIKSLNYNVLDPSSNVLNTGENQLDTSTVGPFNVFITYMGNSTYKPSYLNVQYTVTPAATKIENVLIKTEYKPNEVERIIEQIFQSDKENRIYQQTYAVAEFDVKEVRTGNLIKRSSLIVDTSKAGINQMELVFEGTQTHPATTISVKYTILDRVPTQTILAVSVSIVGILLTIGGILYRLRKKQKTGAA
jgi:hypothetical protein